MYPGEFGSAGYSDNITDAGVFGGGGYYGGTTITQGYSGSGGSSFISGHEGCDAIKDPIQTYNKIIHTNQSIHYSGYRFTSTKMIGGNKTMPLPSGDEGKWIDDNGAFRITLISLYTPIASFNNINKFALLTAIFIFYK